LNFHSATFCFAISLLLGCHAAQTTPVIVPPQWMGQPPPAGVATPAPVMAPAQGMEMQPQWQQPMIGQPQMGVPQFEALPGAGISSTVTVPVTNDEWAWEQIVDVIDDYFDVDQETPVRVVGNVVTEGRIDTFPKIGATIVEPLRRDSVGRYNRWESTFQTIRRRAEIRVMPQQGGYLLDAVVLKELEDLPRPEHSTAGAASFRFDNSLPSRLEERVSPTRLSRFWIPMGRDTVLEQKLLNDIHERLTTNVPPTRPHSLLHHHH